jgi:hypothetical protein
VAASQNHGPLKLYELKDPPMQLRVNADDAYALLHNKDGSIEKKEFYYGESFLSQSGRFFSIGKNVASIEVFDNRGHPRRRPVFLPLHGVRHP